MKNIHVQILEHIRSGQALILATVVKTSGSTPQKPGSSALFGEKGLIAGTIGGGQLEANVTDLAMDALLSKKSGLFHFDLNSGSESEGAICGGEADVLLDANPEIHSLIFEEVERELEKGRAGSICTRTSQKGENSFSIERTWIREGNTHPSSKENNGCIFIEPIHPLPRLIIAGAGHVGQALAHLASLLDFEITLIDDRKEYACPAHVPDADHFIVKDIGRAMADIVFDPSTYIVIVTRDHTNDARALKSCIATEAAYVGMIGSRKKVGRIKKSFLAKGLATEEQWSKIHTPIGISIGSQSVQEIALSIAAQLVSERSNKTSGDA